MYIELFIFFFFFFSSRRRHTRLQGDWSSDVCSSDLYDIVVIAAGDFEDGDGCRLRRWEVGDAAPRLASSERRVADVEDRLLSLESQVGELAERLDFAERLLARARERGTLPKG